jgi:hypothetical protein
MKRTAVPDELRKRVIILDGGGCQLCGFAFALNVHHVVPSADGGTNTLTNLVAVCPNHHALAHSGLIAADQFTTNPELRPNIPHQRAFQSLFEEALRCADNPAKMAEFEVEFPKRMAAAHDPEKYRAAYTVFIQWRNRRRPARSK